MSNIDKRALREAANAANAASWGYWEPYKPHKGARGYEVKVGVKAVAQHCLKVDSAFIAAANPATVLALLDELEAAGKSIDFLKDQLAQLANFNPDWDKLEAATDSLREHMDELTAARTRIAELEALQRKPVMFIDGDISPSDAEKLAAVISEFNEETETPAARMARIIRENPHPTNMCDMPAAGTTKGE
ncbi:ead/Ea22-like family protein [Enterobacter kobei]|uniref:ead/Ea22-like family protein n=1 Tax=Enterobacter kobei TaxID=208224 RepID=UPI00210BD7DC|nr:ead/Ea22-like family protein [Enterobacter kobei]MCQ4372591.1 ead/Ea22-like family protein [Enterobacter kobei]